ncbi:MAG TPA: hypothetical protein VGQ44_19540 [Gemmatimonadaceae bacterium]|nr:hypothetical protein [Gemmatimonadaceae bacterium]
MSFRQLCKPRTAVFVLVVASAAAPCLALSQSIPGAVMAQREPHHHLVYEDSVIRVLRVRVPAHDTTLLHEHDPDYFWISLGPSTLVNVRPGNPDATVASADLAFHYSFGKFAHIARNPGNAPFDNITVELLEPQTGVRNLCEAAVSEKPLDCHQSSTGQKARFSGGREHPAFVTDEITVSLHEIDPGGTLRPSAGAKGGAAWVIALDSADAKQKLVVGGGPRWVGGTFRAAKGQAWVLSNMSDGVIRVISVVRN